MCIIFITKRNFLCERPLNIFNLTLEIHDNSNENETATMSISDDLPHIRQTINNSNIHFIVGNNEFNLKCTSISRCDIRMEMKPTPRY